MHFFIWEHLVQESLNLSFCGNQNILSTNISLIYFLTHTHSQILSHTQKHTHLSQTHEFTHSNTHTQISHTPTATHNEVDFRPRFVSIQYLQIKKIAHV